MKKSFTKTKKVKKRIELNKKKDGTYGFDLDKNLKIKIVPGKSIPRGLRYGDKLLSLDGIKINNKSDLEQAIKNRYSWMPVSIHPPADFLFEGLHPIRGKYSKKTLSKISEVSSSKEKSKPLKMSSSKSSKKSLSKSSKKSLSKSSKKSSRGSKRKSRKLRKSRRR